jgi:hypothetical protein
MRQQGRSVLEHLRQSVSQPVMLNLVCAEEEEREGPVHEMFLQHS